MVLTIIVIGVTVWISPDKQKTPQESSNTYVYIEEDVKGGELVPRITSHMIRFGFPAAKGGYFSVEWARKGNTSEGVGRWKRELHGQTLGKGWVKVMNTSNDPAADLEGWKHLVLLEFQDGDDGDKVVQGSLKR
jgi:hypothetical protein